MYGMHLSTNGRTSIVWISMDTWLDALGAAEYTVVGRWVPHCGVEDVPRLVEYCI